MPVVPKESKLAPGQYNENIDSVKVQAPKVSFPKSSRFLSQKVNATGQGHQRELMTHESPGPKYNVNSLASNGGKAGAPKFSFAPPSPETKTRLPNVESPRKGHRESWMSVVNRNGVLVMPASPTPPHANVTPEQVARAQEESNNPSPSSRGGGAKIGTVFGNEHRFGVRQQDSRGLAKTPRQGQQRVQFVSAKHMRENMGEFSPGPIYMPYNPECPGGRLAPSPKSGRRPLPPGSPPHDKKDANANLSSRSSWLAGNVRKFDGGLETVLMRTGDVPPGPGSYADPRSSFATVSHNAKANGGLMKATRPHATVYVHPHPPNNGAMSARKSESRDAQLRTTELANTMRSVD
uniref:Uncharacterized protein n=1 Tax=Globisporangium ultimum (strain ATCC 200006 / CBS 805.95 / DAOM BR144) TaxID=431595 RepID=K3WHS0_GLOUD